MKRKIIDERGLLFGKISCVDILAVLAVLALDIMVFTRFFSGGEGNVSNTGTVDLVYTVEVQKVRTPTAGALAVGDGMYTSDGQYMGQIVRVDSRPCVSLESTPDGRVVEMENEGYLDVTVEVKAPCTLSGGRYYVNGAFELGVNATVKFVTRYVSSTCVITQVGQSAQG